MKRTGQKIVVAGAGAAGLSVAVGLAQEGHDVTVLERRTAEFLRRGRAQALPERLYESTSGYPQMRGGAQESLCEAENFRRRIPEAVVELPARYFVSDAATGTVIPSCRENARKYSEDPNDRSPVAPTFQRTHALRTLRLQDRVIHPAWLIQTLLGQLWQSGGRTITSAEVIGCRRAENQIVTIIARSPHGVQRFPCDVFVNAAGSRVQRVNDSIGGHVLMRGCWKTVATPVLRFPWPFSIEPTILQFFGTPGAQVLSNLRVMPIGNTRSASVSTSDWFAVDDAGRINGDIEAERRRLLRLMAEGFDLLELPEPQEISWSVKALPVPATTSAIEGDQGGHDGVILDILVGRSENEFHCWPGRLRSVLTLRDAVGTAVAQYLERQGGLVAA